MPRPTRLEQLWSWLQEDHWTLVLLVACLALALAPIWIPQAPDAAAASADLLQAWLSTWPVHRALSLKYLAALGLFTLHRSLWLKVLLAALGGLSLVRGAGLLEAWPRLTLRQRAAHLGLDLGLLLLLIGGLEQWYFSHSYTSLPAWPGETLSLPTPAGLRLLTAPASSRPAWQQGYLLLPRQTGIGLRVEAHDPQGNALHLITRPQEEGQTEWHFAFTPETPEAYCALPEVGLVFRFTLINRAGQAALAVEGYRQSSGQLISSLEIQRTMHLFTEKAVLNLTRLDVQYVDAISYPGWPWAAGGTVLLSLGWLVKLIPIEFFTRLSWRRR